MFGTFCVPSGKVMLETTTSSWLSFQSDREEGEGDECDQQAHNNAQRGPVIRQSEPCSRCQSRVFFSYA